MRLVTFTENDTTRIGLLKDGKLVYLMERHDIEGREANEIAAKLVDAFDQHCSKVA